MHSSIKTFKCLSRNLMVGTSCSTSRLNVQSSSAYLIEGCRGWGRGLCGVSWRLVELPQGEKLTCNCLHGVVYLPKPCLTCRKKDRYNNTAHYCETSFSSLFTSVSLALEFWLSTHHLAYILQSITIIVMGLSADIVPVSPNISVKKHALKVVQYNWTVNS